MKKDNSKVSSKQGSFIYHNHRSRATNLIKIDESYKSIDSFGNSTEDKLVSILMQSFTGYSEHTKNTSEVGINLSKEKEQLAAQLVSETVETAKLELNKNTSTLLKTKLSFLIFLACFDQTSFILDTLESEFEATMTPSRFVKYIVEEVYEQKLEKQHQTLRDVLETSS